MISNILHVIKSFLIFYIKVRFKYIIYVSKYILAEMCLINKIKNLNYVLLSENIICLYRWSWSEFLINLKRL